MVVKYYFTDEDYRSNAWHGLEKKRKRDFSRSVGCNLYYSDVHFNLQSIVAFFYGNIFKACAMNDSIV